MSSPSSPAIGLVSANIKLFNSKSDNEPTLKTSNSATTINTNTPNPNYLPPLPPKPTKKLDRLSPPPPLPPSPPPPPPLVASSAASLPPPLPATPPRPIRNGTLKPNYSGNNNNNNNHKKITALSSSSTSSLTNATPSPIVAQRSGSTLKGMLGKVVGSVSGKLE